MRERIAAARTEDQIILANRAYLAAETDLEKTSVLAIEAKSTIAIREAEARMAAVTVKSSELRRSVAATEARRADPLRYVPTYRAGCQRLGEKRA